MSAWRACPYERVYTAINAQRRGDPACRGSSFQGGIFARRCQPRYYAVFYIAEALLNEKDLRFKKHGTVHGSFSQHFVKTGIFDAKYHKLLTKSFGQRMLGDYDEVTRFTSGEVIQILEQAWDFLKTAKDYFASSHNYMGFLPGNRVGHGTWELPPSSFPPNGGRANIPRPASTAGPRACKRIPSEGRLRFDHCGCDSSFCI